MQVDMHYYGTYALARAAGLATEVAQRIADASQFVDGYTEERDIETNDGALISYWPSGHGMVCDANFDPAGLDRADPHKVWVPFHFIPGGTGASYQESMRCIKDGEPVRALLGRVLEKSKEPSAPELIGIAAHIYADTFSHYGFSGLRSDGNLVIQESITFEDEDADIIDYIMGKANGFFGRIAGNATRGLGHACVADFPDRPYLKWGFTYENGEPSGLRDNPATYLEACEKLFAFFTDFRSRTADDGGARDFGSIRTTVAGILAFEGTEEERSREWQQAASDAALLFDGGIPDYRESINEEIFAVQERPMSEVKNERVWSFAHGVEVVRSMVLYELLPERSLIG